MKLRSLIAGITMLGGLAINELPAQEVQFKTMEMRSVSGVQEPEYVTVVQSRRRVYRRRPVGTRHYIVKKRSKKKSVAIVGGSAATGAAIGALAGGGKGAAIGAIAGGAGGLIYDRNTNKKRVRVQ